MADDREGLRQANIQVWLRLCIWSVKGEGGVPSSEVQRKF